MGESTSVEQFIANSRREVIGSMWDTKRKKEVWDNTLATTEDAIGDRWVLSDKGGKTSTMNRRHDRPQV